MTGEPWTKAQDAVVIDAFFDGLLDADIARKLEGRTAHAVKNRRFALGLKNREVRTHSPERIDRMRELAAQGLSAREIGRELGISRNAVIGALFRTGKTLTEWRKGAKLAPPPPPPPPPEPPPEPPKMVTKGKEPWQCRSPGCRGTKQPGRDFCATHNPVPERTRAGMFQITASGGGW